MIPNGAEYFVTEHSVITFYKVETLETLRMRVLSRYYPAVNQWSIGGFMPWEEIKPIAEFKEPA